MHCMLRCQCLLQVTAVTTARLHARTSAGVHAQNTQVLPSV
jgi:hypothetical protein